MSTSHRYLCIHGHFYQPPREDPFTHVMPSEIGAGPYHDFNEKITHECYRPNMQAHNFEAISFNIGPTLASWMARQARDVYTGIVEADKSYTRRFGTGNAIAQAYNHTILPLASRRDKQTQIIWGISDFQHRYGRFPAGMWCGETAIDMETLSLLEAQGLRYTILAPWQAAQGVDVTEPYWVKLPNGNRFAVFFYQGPISGDVSFNDSVTTNADAFAAAYLPNFLNWEKANRGDDQILTISTDGELYGHHKPFRDLFLAHLVRHSAPAFGYEVITPERFLDLRPPRHDVLINAPSAWSCAHGVARWSTGCDCTDGDHAWKPIMLQAIRNLAHNIDQHFEHQGSLTLADPWEARDHFLEWRNGWISSQAFWSSYGRNGRKPGKESLAVRTWHLLEAEYCMQAAYTSCGWFFEDLDRIEPRIDLNSARCAISHIWQALHIDLQQGFLQDLENAHAWRSRLTGPEIYQQLPRVPSPDLLPAAVPVSMHV